MAGQPIRYGIGVAIGSKWIASKGCNNQGSCPTLDLLESLEFMACPTKGDGTDPDCSKSPDVINNSWGGGQGQSWYADVLGTLLAMRIIPVFSEGNSGSSCGTANSPGDSALVIGVGATDENDMLASFSSRGPGVNLPGVDPYQPDVSAPGVQTMSAYNGADDEYAFASGTSMACPHVSGVVALVLGADYTIVPKEMEQLLETTSDTQTLKRPTSGAAECGGTPYNEFPNYLYGFGRVNACSAINKATGEDSCKK